MDIEDIIETHIFPTLRETLGEYEARALLTRATIAYLTSTGSHQEKYLVLIRSICSDEKLAALLGENLALVRKEWRALIGTDLS